MKNAVNWLKNKWNILYSNEYFFGSNILVSPILHKKDNIMN